MRKLRTSSADQTSPSPSGGSPPYCISYLASFFALCSYNIPDRHLS